MGFDLIRKLGLKPNLMVRIVLTILRGHALVNHGLIINVSLRDHALKKRLKNLSQNF